jgi:hypothetical protein
LLADCLSAFLQNELGEREVARISDLEIKIVVWNENHFAAQQLNGGNFVGHRQMFFRNDVVSFLQ